MALILTSVFPSVYYVCSCSNKIPDMNEETSDDEAIQEIYSDNAAARLLAACWLSTLGYLPTSSSDTLSRHAVSAKDRRRLLRAIRVTFNCDFDFRLFPPDMSFGKSAELLRPLAPCEDVHKDASRPVVWLAPGLGGAGLGELLLAGAFSRPGRIHLLRYPSLTQISASKNGIEAHVDAVLRQLPADGDRKGLILAGYSMGAHLMHEVACRLEKQGKPIACLILIHSIASPQRKDLRGHDFRLVECRRPHDLIRWAEWKLGVDNRLLLRVWSRMLSILKAVGFAETAYRCDQALSCVIRLKAFSYAIRHSCYRGESVLLRPTGGGSVAEFDAGWSPYCGALQIRPVAVPTRDFLKGNNRRLVADELAQLVSETLKALV
jgi:pimeloyl-ACP methyl ester carboxylesterase